MHVNKDQTTIIQNQPQLPQKAQILEGGRIRFSDKIYTVAFYPAGSTTKGELTQAQMLKAAAAFVKLLEEMDGQKDVHGLTLTKTSISQGEDSKALPQEHKEMVSALFEKNLYVDEKQEEHIVLEEQKPPPLPLKKMDFKLPTQTTSSSERAAEYLKLAKNYKEGRSQLPEGVLSITKFPVDSCGKIKTEIKLANNQSVLINEFQEKAYRGPTHGDFQDKLENMKNSIEEQIVGDNTKLKEILEKTYAEASLSLKKNAQEHPNIDVRNQKGKEGFDLAFKSGEKILAQFMVDLGYLAKKEGVKITPGIIKKAEREYIVNHPRPTVINTYQIRNPKDYSDVKTFLSMQQPRGATTLPSTARERKGLGNYVTTSHGVMQPNGEVKINYEGIRHTSYPPIHIKNRKERREIAIENVEQEVRDVAINLIQKEVPTNNSEPLVVNIRTMMLLTAKSIDFVRNKEYGVFGRWKGEGETLMLEDSVYALKQVDGKLMEIDIDGKKYWIKPDLSAMNLGVNDTASSDKGGLIGKLPDGKIQDVLNKQGFVRFVNEAGVYLNKELGNKIDFNHLSSKERKELSQGLRKDGLTKLADLVSLVDDAINLYTSGKHQKAAHITDFQTCFLLANYLMGNTTTFFCKSAEDRTGNQNNRIEEYLVYKEFYPNGIVSEKEAFRAEIGPKVHMFSASQDNTYFNSFARGLQTGAKVNNDYPELAETGKKMGCLAKTPFALAGKLKPSKWALNFQ